MSSIPVFSFISSIAPNPRTVSSFLGLKECLILNWASVKVGKNGKPIISKRN